MTSFSLKFLACILMLIDHLAHIIPNPLAFYLHLVGRIAFPIFAFQLVQGYTHTKNVKVYLTRLLILSLVSQIPFNLYFNNFPELNIFFTLLLGLLAIHIYSTLKYKSISLIFIGIIIYTATFLKTDYSWFGILLILIFYLFNNHKAILVCSFATITFAYFAVSSNIFNFNVMCLCLCTIAAIIPLLFYNGNQGKKVKYLFYIFYPLHLSILYFIKVIFI